VKFGEATESLRTFRRTAPDVPVIVVSGLLRSVGLRAELAAGAVVDALRKDEIEPQEFQIAW
jgi:predicted TIM-barrel enzyme